MIFKVGLGSVLAMLVMGICSFACGQADGSLIAWGGLQQVDDSELNDLVALAGGGLHSLGLRSDGSVVAWGVNF